ncbi:4-hydroxy-tetrahydrodipicolinate reductase [Bartonella sp. DGB1]|uniref:4-hydroxy-tetrahydrodipicolinate reductase n=1 Tax=Bartonella sp. DGB1 TaxID=3239807 RepID=UPI003526BB6B
MQKNNIVITGINGRMGQEILKALTDNNRFLLVGAVARENSPLIGKSLTEAFQSEEKDIIINANLTEINANIDAIIDFTSPEISLTYANFACENKIPFITGTTGWNHKQEEIFKELAKKNIIVKSGNMSLGINLLAKIVEFTAGQLKAGCFDIEILEMHHRNKVDAPSGTALLLGQAAAAGRKINLNECKKTVRDGQTGKREEGEIGFATLRGGQVAGFHSVIFAGLDETLEFNHTAHNRKIFAQGALTAAEWAIKQKKTGLYSMQDIINFKGTNENDK